MLAVMAVYPGLARANPSDGQVVAGSADITSNSKTLTVQQNTGRAVIDWRSFDIAPDETTRFVQPDSNSAVLNRVKSNDPSVIAGQLQANGHVILVNPNGVLFDSTSKVDVNGLIATTADIDNDAFMAGSGNFNKPGSPTAKIENRGTITAAEAGLVGLVAPQVINSGTISARLGRVQLSSGDSVTVDLYGDGLLEVKASDALANQLVENSGVLQADGGTIAMTAAAARDTVNAVVKVGGELKATSVGQRQGRVIIAAEGSHAVSGNSTAEQDQRSGTSTVLVTGRIDVSGKGEATAKGGQATITADHIALLSGSSIGASGRAGGGTVLIGGDYLGQGDTPVAQATIMQAGAAIDASATDEGDGGKVIVYADNYTDFAGDIDTSGSGESGNGGLVETSGRYALVASGNVRVRSGHKGMAGSWLLDPADVTLTTTTTNNSGAPSFTPIGTGSQINVATIVSSLNAGTNVTIATSNDGYAGNGDITVSSSITSTGSGALTLSAYRNINVNTGITLNGGALTLRSDNSGTGSGAIGISGAITTNGGNITIGGGSGAISAGTGYTYGNAARVVGVDISSAINAGGGNIIINGRGYATTTDNNYGIRSSGLISTSGTGTISLNGMGGGAGGSNNNFAVYLQSGVTAVNGDITINGTGGSSTTGGSNYGSVLSSTGGYARTTGTGNISVTGSGGTGTGGNQQGVVINYLNALQTTTGNITINGTGNGSGTGGSGYGVVIGGSVAASVVSAGGAINITGSSNNTSTGSSNHGIYVGVVAGTSITNTGNGSITLTGTAGGGTPSSGNNGITIANSAVISTVNGALTLTGTGGGGGSGTSNHGIALGTTGASISTSGTGNITITGTSGNASGSGGSSMGVSVSSSNGITTSGSGNITITGTSAGSGTKTSGGNHGVTLSRANSIATSGSGHISITGYGAQATGAYNYGISLQGGAANVATTGTGNITLTGYGGSGNSGDNNGIVFDNGYVTTTGSSTITINGNGGGSGNASNSRGIYFANGGYASSINGNMTLTGVGGGSGSGANSSGIYFRDANSRVFTTGTGNITLTGTGGNNAGTGGGNHGIQFDNTNAITTSGTGSISLTGTKGGQSSSYGISTLAGTLNAAATTGTAGNISVFSDTISYGNPGAGNYLFNSVGTLTLAPLTAITMGVGSGSGTLSYTDTLLSYMAASAYVFGSTTADTITISTSRDFGDRNLSFISGTDVSLAGSLTKSSGTGTANYLFQANNQITNNTGIGITASSGKINLTFNADYDRATTPGGRVSLSGGTFTTNGGNIVIGGGTTPLTSYIYSSIYSAISLSSSNVLNAGAGNITLRGENGGTSSLVAVSLLGGITTTSGSVNIYGLSSTTGSVSRAVLLNGSTANIQTGSGNINITGINTSGVSTNYSFLMYNTGTTGGTLSSTSGNITIDTSRSSNESSFGLVTSNTTTPAIQTGSGNITLLADTIYNATSQTQLSTANGTLTIAPKTGVTMTVGPTTGAALMLPTTFLNQMTAANYVFGSTAAGNLTINTTRDFGNANVSFISGGNITLTGNLTKGSNTGTATYLLQAAGNISNSGGAGIVASTGLINLALTSDADISGSGSITLTSAPLSVNGGTITLTSNGQSVTQSGSIGGNETISSGNGAISIGTLNGDTAGTRSLTANAGTATFTTTGIIGGTAKLNNMTVSSNDVALGAALGGTGTLILQPYSNSSELRLNSATAGGTYSLSSTELGYLTDGWAGIEIGKSTGSGSFYIGTSTWNDPITFRNNFRTQLDGALTAAGNASVTFNVGTSGWVNTFSSITTAGQNVSFLGGAALTGANNITTNGGSISLAGPTQISTGVAISPVWSTSGGNITFNGPMLRNTSGGSTASRTFTLNASTGSISFNSTVNGDHSLSATAASMSFNGIWGGSEAPNSISLTSTSSLSLPSITAGSILARTTGTTADITLGSGKLLTASGSGTAITLAAGRNFINSSGSSTPLATASGRWLVYATSPAGNTLGGMTSGFVRYSCTYSGSCPTLAGSGNGLLYTYTPTLTATPRALTLTYGDAAPALTAYTYDLSGYLTSAAGNDASSDSVTGTLSGTTGYTQGSNIGSYGISYGSGTLASALGYNFTYANNSSAITVDPRTLTLGLTGSTSKTYSGTTAATLAAGNYSFSGLYGSDTVTVSNTAASYDDANVGTGKTITASGLSISGSKAGNYTLASTTTSGAIGEITRKNVTVTADNKSVVYGNTLPPLTASYSGFVSGEDENVLTTAATLASATASSADIGIYTGTLTASGASADNYSFSYVAGNLTITPRALTVITDNATYSGSGTLPTLTGSNNLLAGDASQISWAYAAPGYAGLAGVYTITASASDPANRLNNYIRTNSYGSLSVTADSAPVIPPISASVEVSMAAGPRLPNVIVVNTTPQATAGDSSEKTSTQVIVVANTQLTGLPNSPAIAGSISMAPELSEHLGHEQD